MTTKQRLIAGIESLYPIDSNYKDTNLMGQALLLDAISEPGFNWRDLPENLLQIYHDKCVQAERWEASQPLNFKLQ